MQATQPYTAKNKIRIVTAASLFDGHDVAINVMRRIMQASGAEVIHLGHNRSVGEIVEAAIQEDVQAIAVTSYQGGHNEFFKYMYDLLQKRGAGHIKIFGGGGGTILPGEIEALQAYGIVRIYSPDDGRRMGLQGMINDLLQKADFPRGNTVNGELKKLSASNPVAVAQLISAVENNAMPANWRDLAGNAQKKQASVLGISGTGGAGKSSLTDELIRRFLLDFGDKTLAVISVDPSKRKSGGALLGDRIRMNAISPELSGGRVYMRSMATRGANRSLSAHVPEVVDLLRTAGYDLIILESAGIGQSDTEIVDFADLALYVMTPDYGAATQLEKIDMLDYANLVAINKFDKRGAPDALRDVKKQFRRNHQLWETPDGALPVFGTIASQFNDPGVNALYKRLLAELNNFGGGFASKLELPVGDAEKLHVIPPERVRYLSEIADNNRQYDARSEEQANLAQQWYALRTSIETLQNEAAGKGQAEMPPIGELEQAARLLQGGLDAQNLEIIEGWNKKREAYKNEVFSYLVRNRKIEVQTHTESLSHTKIPKIVLPRYEAWGDVLRWVLQENVPGEFPYTAGVYPFKREGEDPTRMFAGEGGPERTNKRFHYLSKDVPGTRLSTAFDSVTLYGENPGHRPDIYGKIGNSGVSVCCTDDAKKLYSGFRLTDRSTSVSMTINGPAAAVTAFFLNAAIDQECEVYIRQNGLEKEVAAKLEAIFGGQGLPQPQYGGKLPDGNGGLGLMLLGTSGDKVLPRELYEKIKAETLQKVRGTVQADILKEDQAQNTCIFSTEFSLRLMGDMQQYFIENDVRNFYSVSISGYHIAEAGANPISQLAFTLSNGFTYVEYYLSRGMDINEFAPNLSFFFSNGIDPEYAVIGRVARRIWAKAMKFKYKANERSQKLKYHIQTSGRSLHAQEISFNDIRTTLQALYAIYDNCNSLHTNAYDEAITTPTEESVRRAMAIQLIINHELGLAKNQNPLQGAFIIEELTDLVEEAVLAEFDRITERGGVLGAMETMYQRGKIQEESMYYEHLKHSGEYPVIGVNTFLSSEGSPTIIPGEVIRATQAEKEAQIATLESLHRRHASHAPEMLERLQQKALHNGNMFGELMETAKYCSLGQITGALYLAGGRYRRNM